MLAIHHYFRHLYFMEVGCEDGSNEQRMTQKPNY